MLIYNSKHIKKPVLDFMKFSYIFTLIVLAIMNITLFICAINGIDSKPRNESTATTAYASLRSSTISVEPHTTTLPSVDADKGQMENMISNLKIQQLLSQINTNCGCEFIKNYDCGTSAKRLEITDPYVKGNESQFYDKHFPLFYMTADEKESARNIFEPYREGIYFEFGDNPAFCLSWLLLYMHKLCAETVPSKIMSACESNSWLEPVSNIYNCRKRLDLLAGYRLPDGIGILENNKDGFTIHTLINRIIRKIDLDINDCLNKILSQEQKDIVASYYAKKVHYGSIYDVLAKDKLKYSPRSLPKHTRRQRNIKFTVTSNQKAETSNQGTSGHKINKQLDSDVKRNVERMVQEE